VEDIFFLAYLNGNLENSDFFHVLRQLLMYSVRIVMHVFSMASCTASCTSSSTSRCTDSSRASQLRSQLLRKLHSQLLAAQPAGQTDRVGLRHRPGSVHPHVSAMHDGQPGSYTYVGDLYFPDYSGGMSQYFGPQVSPNVDRGGANAFRVLAGLPAERKHHFHHFNPHMQPPMQMPY
jgi:hypothetical protein